jgi:adenylate cyclase
MGSEMASRSLAFIIVVALTLGFAALRIWDPARLTVFDTYQRIKPRPYTNLPVTIIDIDNKSLKEFGQ